jgi:exosortase/archaeosortase family protein
VERAIIVLSAIPIAIFVNSFRVALTGILTHRFGQQAAEGVIHMTEGFFTFALAFVLLLGEAWLLQRVWPERRSERATRTT